MKHEEAIALLEQAHSHVEDVDQAVQFLIGHAGSDFAQGMKVGMTRARLAEALICIKVTATEIKGALNARR